MKRARVVAAVLTWAVTAHADNPVIVAPRPRDVSVVYPANAHGAAVVVLELVLRDDGTVVSVRVLAGAEPFLSAAKSAAQGFTFEPATRDGRAIGARLRVEVPFHDDSVASPPPVHLAVVDVRPIPVPRRPSDVEDVRVRGTRKELGGTVMTKEEVRDMPGAFGDAFRAIDMMPGVTPIVSGLPFFFIRGAPPGNTGYFVDDVRVPLLYHLALGPSVIHPSLIDRVDFYPGGLPAEYGRFTGGIINGETKGPSSRVIGEAEVRVYDAGVLGEAPFAGGKGDALVSGRYGYPGPLVSIFAPSNQVSYWDYQGRLSYRVTPRDTLTAFVFGSFDELDQRDNLPPPNSTSYGPFYPLFRTEFHRADLRWDHAVAGGTLRTALTFGLDNSLGGGGGGSDVEGVQAQSIQLRTQLDRTLSKGLRFRAGADVLLYHYDYSETFVVDEVSTPVAFPSRNDVMFGGYADVVWRVHPRVEIVPGLRFDVFTSRSAGQLPSSNVLSLVTGNKAAAAPAIDPRLSARVTVSPALAWVGTFGVTHQPPSFVLPVPGGELGSLADGLQTAVQASQGFEAKLPLDLELKGTFFLQRYLDVTNALATCFDVQGGDFPSASCIDQRSNGTAAGIEVLFKRSFSKRIAGWVSYTFSRSTTEVPNPARGQPSVVPSSFDRPNVLNAVLALDCGKGWHAGARFTYYTGLPYTPTTSDGVPLSSFNGARLPDVWRIDVRLEKRWRLGAHSQVAVVLEGLNVTFNKEAIGATCSTSGKCVPDYIGPIAVPSLGIEAKY